MGRLIVSNVFSASRQIKPFEIITFFHEETAETLNQGCNIANFSLNRQIIAKNLMRLKLAACKGETSILSGAQVGISQALMVMHKNAHINHYFHKQYNNPQLYQSIINPKILQAKDVIEIEQENVSFPFIYSKTKRFKQINVKFYDEQEKQHSATLKDFQAVIFQQGYDFLIGRHILDWRLHFGNIWVQEDIKDKLPKTTSVIQQYSKELKKCFEKFPNLTKIPQILQQEEEEKLQKQSQFGHHWFINRGNSQILSIQQDYLVRIHKHYNKQMALLLERVYQGIIPVKQQD